MDNITRMLEDNRAGVVLSTIDFSEAFNRLEYGKCLDTFAKKGSSTEILRLLGTFLMGRKMTVKVGGELFTPRLVNAGAP